MSSEDEHPTGSASQATKRTTKKPTFRSLVADLGNTTALDSVTKILGIQDFDPVTAKCFADNGYLTICEATMDDIRAEAKGQCLSQTEPQAPFKYSSSSTPMIAALVRLAGTVFLYTNRTSLKKPAASTRPVQCKVTLCNERAVHSNEGGPVRFFLPIGDAIVISVTTSDKPVYTCKYAVPSFPMEDSNLFITYTPRRGGWGTQIKVYRALGGDKSASTWYLMFTESTAEDDVPVLVKRSSDQIKRDYNATLKNKTPLMSKVLATEMNSLEFNTRISLASLVAETAIATSLFFDNTSLLEGSVIANKIIEWIKESDVKKLFGIEGNGPLSLDGDKTEISSVCQQFMSTVQNNVEYWHDIKFFDNAENKLAGYAVLDEAGVPPVISATCASYTATYTTRKFELLISCLYFVAVCQFVARSSPRKASAINYTTLCLSLWKADSVLSEQFQDADAIQFFEHLMTPQSTTSSKKSKKVVVHNEVKEPVAAPKQQPPNPVATKYPKKQPMKQVQQPMKQVQRKSSKFIDGAAEGEDDDDDDADGEEEGDDQSEADSFIADSSDEEEGGEDEPYAKNPYFDASDDDDVSHVSGTDEEDMGRKFKTPVSRKKSTAPPPVKHAKKRKDTADEEVKEPPRVATGTKRGLEREFPTEEEPKTQKKGRLSTEAVENKEDRTNLLRPVTPPPPKTTTPMLDVTETDVLPIQSPLVAKPVEREDPFSFLSNLKVSEYARASKDWKPETHEQFFRDARIIKYQNDHLGDQVRHLKTNRGAAFDTILSPTNLRDLDCWLVRCKLPAAVMVSQLGAAANRIIEFEKTYFGFDHRNNKPRDCVLGTMVKTITIGKPIKDDYYMALTYIQNQKQRYTRISRIAVMASADGTALLKPMTISSNMIDGQIDIDAEDPNVHGFVPFMNIYMIFAPKGEKVDQKLQEVFAGLYISIEKFTF